MLEKSVTKFTLDMDKAIDRFLSKAIRSGDTTNIILSPLNLVNTLSVIHLGALGKTFDEISYVLGLRGNRYFESHSDLVYATFASLMEQVCAHKVNSSNPSITTSTIIFSQVRYCLKLELFLRRICTIFIITAITHGENFMSIFTTLSVVIWFPTGTLGIFATLVYVFTMRVVIYDILSIAIIPTLSTSKLFCNLCYILL